MYPQQFQTEAGGRSVSPIASGSHAADAPAPLPNMPQNPDYDVIQLALQVVSAMYGNQAVDVHKNQENEEDIEEGNGDDYEEEDEDEYEDEGMVLHVDFPNRPPSSGSDSTSRWSVPANEDENFKPQDERRSSVPAYDRRLDSFEVGINMGPQVIVLEEAFSETIDRAGIDGEEVNDEGVEGYTDEEDSGEENADVWLGEDIFVEEVARNTTRLDPRLVEDRHVLPPHVFPRMKEHALPFVVFGKLKGLRLSFQQIQPIQGGNGSSIIEVVRSVGTTEDGFGLPENSVWVMKRFRNLAGNLRKEAQDQQQTECEAYRRIAESPRQGKIGFSFLMALEASITTQYEVGLVMSFMPSNLEILLSKNISELPRSDARRIMAQMSIAVATLHSIGIIHSDLKPSNVLLDARGNVKLADFGLSYVAEELGPLVRKGKYTFACVGTEGYRAPEKLTSQKRYGYEVDYWSLGCILFEMVTGYAVDSVLALSSPDDLQDWGEFFSEPSQRREYFQEISGLENNDVALPVLCGLLDPNPLRRMAIGDLLFEEFFVDYFTSLVMKKNIVPTGYPIPQEQSAAAEDDLKDIITAQGPIYHSIPANNTLYQWVNPYGLCVPHSARIG